MQHSNHRTAAFIASRPARIITSAALAVALTATPMLSPVAAYAASQATQDQLSAAQQKIEAATSAYNEARTKLEDLQKQIDTNEASIEQIEAELPDQINRSKLRMIFHPKVVYHHQTNSDYRCTYYSEVITRKKIEELVHLNQDHINREFKKQTGYTLMEYVQHYRILMAKKMLRETTLSISEISIRTGYDSPAYFSKIFKKQTERTPLEYRAAKAKG